MYSNFYIEITPIEDLALEKKIPYIRDKVVKKSMSKMNLNLLRIILKRWAKVGVSEEASEANYYLRAWSDQDNTIRN